MLASTPIENGPVEIVDFPMNSMVLFHSYVTVHQRVSGIPYLGVSENVVYPQFTQWFCWSDNPVFKWLAIIGNINPTFSDKPILGQLTIIRTSSPRR